MENENRYLFISKHTVTEKLRECLHKLLNYLISRQLFLETNMAEIFKLTRGNQTAWKEQNDMLVNLLINYKMQNKRT